MELSLRMQADIEKLVIKEYYDIFNGFNYIAYNEALCSSLEDLSKEKIKIDDIKIIVNRLCDAIVNIKKTLEEREAVKARDEAKKELQKAKEKMRKLQGKLEGSVGKDDQEDENDDENED